MASLKEEVIRNASLKLKCLLHLGASDLRVPIQTGEETALARSLETFQIDVSCITETHK